MITEDVLERGLAAAAEGYEPPAGAVDRLRERITPSVAAPDQPRQRGRMPKPHGWQWVAIAAACLVLLIAVPIAVGGRSGSAQRPSAQDFTNGLTPTKFTKLGTGDVPAAGRVQAPVPAPTSALDRLGTTASGAGGTTLAHKALGTAGAPQQAYAPDQSARASQTSRVQNGPDSPIPLPGAQQRIVRTGDLVLRVGKGEVNVTATRLTGVATGVGGYVESSRAATGRADATAVVTMRVPVARFDEAIKQAQALGKSVSLQTSSDDVTSKYVDLSARIRSLDQTRNAFRTLLSRANTIGQTLTVQSRIDAVQTEIERLTAQRKLLASQSAMSTLTVTVNQPTPEPVVAAKHHKQSGLSKAFHTSVSRFVHGVEAIIAIIGPILLVLILAVLAWFAAKLGYRRFRRSMV